MVNGGVRAARRGPAASDRGDVLRSEVMLGTEDEEERPGFCIGSSDAFDSMDPANACCVMASKFGSGGSSISASKN